MQYSKQPRQVICSLQEEGKGLVLGFVPSLRLPRPALAPASPACQEAADEFIVRCSRAAASSIEMFCTYPSQQLECNLQPLLPPAVSLLSDGLSVKLGVLCCSQFTLYYLSALSE